MITRPLVYFSILASAGLLATLSSLPYSYAATFSGTVTVAATCGIAFPTGTPVNYGTVLLVGDITPEQTVGIENTGRSQEVVNVHGTAWTDGATTIMNVGDTHSSATSGSYASKAALTGSDAQITTLNNRQTKNTFWQLQANLLNPDYTGTPSQTVTVTGVC